MANYINQEILCEAYTHFKIGEYPSDEKRAELKKQLISFFDERAKFLFGPDVFVTVDFEEGSLITNLRVLGSSALIVAGLVSNYGSIRQGWDTISKDSAMLAQSGVLEIAFRTKTAFCDKVSVEKRKGVFGRAHELVTELDTIRSALDHQALPKTEAELSLYKKHIATLIAWDQKVDKLFTKLENEPTKACISAGLLEELERLPGQPIWAAELAGNSLKMQALKADPGLYASLQGSVQHMLTAASTIKEKMLTRVKQYAPQKA